MNAVIRNVPLRDYRFDLDAIAGALTTRTKVVWLCSPNNPTGTIVQRDEMAAFLDAVPETVAVVIDQAYGEFVDDPGYAEGVRLVREGHRNVIVLKTFSKAYALAGLRLGYAVADGAICQMLDRIEEPFFLNRAATAAGPRGPRRHCVARAFGGRHQGRPGPPHVRPDRAGHVRSCRARRTSSWQTSAPMPESCSSDSCGAD